MNVELRDGGRYTNVFAGGQMIASVDHETGEAVFYGDPRAEEPTDVTEVTPQ